jgi:hypothetical protein
MTGDWLIGAAAGDIIIHFQQPVRLVGKQLSNNFGGPFTAHIQAFSHNKLLGTFTETGNTTSTADNAAIFLGVMDTTPDITDVIYTVTDPRPSSGITINQIAVSQ